MLVNANMLNAERVPYVGWFENDHRDPLKIKTKGKSCKIIQISPEKVAKWTEKRVEKLQCEKTEAATPMHQINPELFTEIFFWHIPDLILLQEARLLAGLEAHLKNGYSPPYSSKN